MRITGIICLVLLMAVGCKKTENIDRSAAKTGINRVLDDWHNAAAGGDFERYFNHFSSDSAIFMGTDATEYWTVTEFKVWSRPYFQDGVGWRYAPLQRHIYISETGRTAWFDEVLLNEGLGEVRGTGVVVKVDTAWKIAHYNLSIPVPNSIADTVAAQIKKALADTTKTE